MSPHEQYRKDVRVANGVLIDAVVRSFLKHIQGVHYGTFADLGRGGVAQQSKYVYRYTRDLIKELKKIETNNVEN